MPGLYVNLFLLHALVFRRQDQISDFFGLKVVCVELATYVSAKPMVSANKVSL